MKLIWPTVEAVRTSVEGYAGGGSIPLGANNNRDFLRRLFHRYECDHNERRRFMPHIKSYTREHGGRLAWVILTSHNLSKAAWGSTMKQGSQFMIRHF
jgi:tyrosyl-DNA phosphodiesterase-1